MALGRKVGFAFLGALLGAMAGGLAGLVAGLVYTEGAATSGFEGYSGYVVALSMLLGIAVGMVAGVIVGWSRATRRDGGRGPSRAERT
ncbi:hypothetical protein [Rubellimicrobium arenae]|uniref:hypothetical protein n=1 Tax=Rubellimicrobium arenae TaxID=2817372 RepID=UPI001B3117A8|nr:hypothetical protein [Rubellimicrobium arenae]